MPRDCNECPYYSVCGSAMGMTDCRFYSCSNEKQSFISMVKNLFSKVFK